MGLVNQVASNFEILGHIVIGRVLQVILSSIAKGNHNFIGYWKIRKDPHQSQLTDNTESYFVQIC